MTGNNPSILVIGSNSSKLNTATSLISSIAKKEIIEQQLFDKKNPTLSFFSTHSPEILILLLDQNNAGILKKLSLLPSKKRPALLIITEDNDTNLMRLSMQAGARDYFIQPVSSSELTNTLRQVISDCSTNITRNGVLTTIINSKGGSGGSLISCNLSHITSSITDKNVMLLDMDLQFGTQSLLLDLHPKYSILEPLNELEKLDRDAMEGYMVRHKSGLRLLTALNDQIILPGEIPQEQLTQFLSLSLDYYDQVFVDLPRQIDSLSTIILEKSDHIVVVIQQSLAHLRDAKRLVRIIKAELNISANKIIVVVNRFSAQSTLQLKDIEVALKCSNIITIPNDYELIANTTNLGIPLFDYARNAPITKAIIDLSEALGIEINSKYKSKGFFRNFLPGL